MQKDKRYRHCCMSGIIFADLEMTTKLIDLKALTGETGIPQEFEDYQITSTISPEYVGQYMRENGLDDYKG
jgi:hypothetical protein